MFSETNSLSPNKLGNAVHSDPNISSTIQTEHEFSGVRNISFSGFDPNHLSAEGSPLKLSPLNKNSPIVKSPWTNFEKHKTQQNRPQNGLMGSLVRKEGHIYSLAAKDHILYTGSDSKNIHVWKNMQEYAVFKSNSGLVKAIIISGDKIFTGHQDGKVRVWKINPQNPIQYKRTGTLPRFFDILKASLKPRNYVEVMRKKTALWIKHCDAISCLCLSQEHGLLYSSSWDRTFKVWRVQDSKCLESVKAHDDAVNSVAVSVEGIVYTGSADGTVKAWKREFAGKAVSHTFIQTLLNQESAVTALVLNKTESILYCGSSDGLVNFWLREKLLSHGGVLKGHKLAVLCLASAGNLLFSGSADKNICVWRIEGGVHRCVSVLTGHTGPVKCLAVEEDKEIFTTSGGDQPWVVYSGSLDKSVKVWSLSEMGPEFQRMRQGHGGAVSWDSKV